MPSVSRWIPPMTTGQWWEIGRTITRAAHRLRDGWARRKYFRNITKRRNRSNTDNAGSSPVCWRQFVALSVYLVEWWPTTRARMILRAVWPWIILWMLRAKSWRSSTAIRYGNLKKKKIVNHFNYKSQIKVKITLIKIEIKHIQSD